MNKLSTKIKRKKIGLFLSFFACCFMFGMTNLQAQPQGTGSQLPGKTKELKVNAQKGPIQFAAIGDRLGQNFRTNTNNATTKSPQHLNQAKRDAAKAKLNKKQLPVKPMPANRVRLDKSELTQEKFIERRKARIAERRNNGQ